MMRPDWIVIGALWGAAGVGMGAFGAHGLQDVATPKELDWWSTAAQYHLLHALALVACGLCVRLSGRGRGAGWALLLGSLVFSGTLYAMALGASTRLGMVTPVGGAGMIAGWLLLARAGLTRDLMRD